jgi:hypothetical protein
MGTQASVLMELLPGLLFFADQYKLYLETIEIVVNLERESRKESRDKELDMSQLCLNPMLLLLIITLLKPLCNI